MNLKTRVAKLEWVNFTEPPRPTLMIGEFDDLEEAAAFFNEKTRQGGGNKHFNGRIYRVEEFMFIWLVGMKPWGSSPDLKSWKSKCNPNAVDWKLFWTTISTGRR
ncbi:hypothetical protein [Methyloglobulus sp.]|uniref:hypothetical protein n=1 Tax=Methyloglobulus sp. TaxID=2518622 RepID=UPI003989E9DB